MTSKEYDVLIIGSGHSGGMAAHTLTQKGVNCLMLDAGPPVDAGRGDTSPGVNRDDGLACAVDGAGEVV